MKHAYIYIVDLSKRLIQFKLLKSPEESGERVLQSEIATLWGYLQARGAELVKV
jgi:hypothetical protein